MTKILLHSKDTKEIIAYINSRSQISYKELLNNFSLVTTNKISSIIRKCIKGGFIVFDHYESNIIGNHHRPKSIYKRIGLVPDNLYDHKYFNNSTIKRCFIEVRYKQSVGCLLVNDLKKPIISFDQAKINEYKVKEFKDKLLANSYIELIKEKQADKVKNLKFNIVTCPV